MKFFCEFKVSKKMLMKPFPDFAIFRDKGTPPAFC